ncbi:MAG: hypothetical protein OEY29_13970 [Gammaproteobacteria bacterium]|nr:hypothetical protein [Gammaproteobacteria bacterium]
MDKNTEDYIPIECSLHSEYELAIMHKTRCNLYWTGDADQKNAQVTPVDLFIRDKQEFLRVKTTQNTLLDIRLDKIIKLSADSY